MRKALCEALVTIAVFVLVFSIASTPTGSANNQPGKSTSQATSVDSRTISTPDAILTVDSPITDAIFSSTTSHTHHLNQASGLTARPASLDSKVLHTDFGQFDCFSVRLGSHREKTVSQKNSQTGIPASATAVDLSSQKAQPGFALLTQQNGHQQSSVTLSGGQGGLNGDDPSLGMNHKVNTASGSASPVTDSLSQPKAQAQKTSMSHPPLQHPSGRQSYSTWWGTAHGIFVFQPLLRHCQHIVCSMTQTLQAMSSHIDSLSTKQLKEQLLPITPWLVCAGLLFSQLLMAYIYLKRPRHQGAPILNKERHEAINSYAQSTLLSLELSSTNDNACDTLRQWCAMQCAKDKEWQQRMDCTTTEVDLVKSKYNHAKAKLFDRGLKLCRKVTIVNGLEQNPAEAVPAANMNLAARTGIAEGNASFASPLRALLHTPHPARSRLSYSSTPAFLGSSSTSGHSLQFPKQGGLMPSDYQARMRTARQASCTSPEACAASPVPDCQARMRTARRSPSPSVEAPTASPAAQRAAPQSTDSGNARSTTSSRTLLYTRSHTGERVSPFLRKLRSLPPRSVQQKSHPSQSRSAAPLMQTQSTQTQELVTCAAPLLQTQSTQTSGLTTATGLATRTSPQVSTVRARQNSLSPPDAAELVLARQTVDRLKANQAAELAAAKSVQLHLQAKLVAALSKHRQWQASAERQHALDVRQLQRRICDADHLAQEGLRAELEAGHRHFQQWRREIEQQHAAEVVQLKKDREAAILDCKATVDDLMRYVDETEEAVAIASGQGSLGPQAYFSSAPHKSLSTPGSTRSNPLYVASTVRAAPQPINVTTAAPPAAQNSKSGSSGLAAATRFELGSPKQLCFPSSIGSQAMPTRSEASSNSANLLTETLARYRRLMGPLPSSSSGSVGISLTVPEQQPAASSGSTSSRQAQYRQGFLPGRGFQPAANSSETALSSSLIVDDWEELPVSRSGSVDEGVSEAALRDRTATASTSECAGTPSDNGSDAPAVTTNGLPVSHESSLALTSAGPLPLPANQLAVIPFLSPALSPQSSVDSDAELDRLLELGLQDSPPADGALALVVPHGALPTTPSWAPNQLAAIPYLSPTLSPQDSVDSDAELDRLLELGLQDSPPADCTLALPAPPTAPVNALAAPCSALLALPSTQQHNTPDRQVVLHSSARTNSTALVPYGYSDAESGAESEDEAHSSSSDGSDQSDCENEQNAAGPHWSRSQAIPTASAAVMEKRLVVRRRRRVTPLANATNILQHSSLTEPATAVASTGGKAWPDPAPEVAQEGGVDTGLAAYLGAAIGLDNDLAPAVSNPASRIIVTPIRQHQITMEVGNNSLESLQRLLLTPEA